MRIPKQLRFLLLLVLLATFSFSGQAQPSHISIIDLFGNRKTNAVEIRKQLQVKEGDSIDFEKSDRSLMEQRLLNIPGVMQARISMTCCDEKDKGWIMYVGISESLPIIGYPAPPKGNDRLPASLMQLDMQFQDGLIKAIQLGEADEDNSQGHSLVRNKKLRAIQEEFIVFARDSFPLLQRVLRYSSMADHRALAAQVIAYGPDKKKVIPELLYRVKDINEAVRNNATRALGVLARYSNKQPHSGLKIPPGLFIEMLNSISWTDRNKGTIVLWSLTEKRDKKILSQLKQQALPSLVEMAQWKNAGHAFAAYMIVGRIAGIPEQDIVTALYSPDKNAVLESWIKRIGHLR